MSLWGHMDRLEEQGYLHDTCDSESLLEQESKVSGESSFHYENDI